MLYQNHEFKGISIEPNSDGTVRLQFGREGDGDGRAIADLTNRQTRVLIGRLMKAAGIELVALTPEGDLVMKDF